jgi:hypothetical protein
VSGVVSARVRGGSDCGHRGIHGGRNWGGGIRTHGAGFLPTRLKVSLLRPLGHAPVPRAKQLRANPNDDARARTGLPSEFGGSSRIGPRTAQSPHLYAGQKRSPNPALTRMQAFRGRDRTRAPQGPSRRSRRSLTPRGVAARRRAFGRFRPASSSTRSSDPARREAERESAGGGSWRRRPRSGRSPPGGLWRGSCLHEVAHVGELALHMVELQDPWIILAAVHAGGAFQMPADERHCGGLAPKLRGSDLVSMLLPS